VNIAIQTITLNPDRSWTFTWNSTGASYYRAVLYGTQLAKVTSTSYTWKGQGYALFPPPVEIVAQGYQALSECFIPFTIIQWYGQTCSSYQIQQLVNGSWQIVDVLSEVGLWIYTYQTIIQSNETQYSYQVVAVDSVGNTSTPVQFVRYVVCPPTTPDGLVTVSYLKPNLVITGS
jgi:hypothetical protein